jgi:hypothetical protein
MDTKLRDFRRHADTCEHLAAATEHCPTRQQLLELARQWRDLILRAEMLEAIRAPHALFSAGHASDYSPARDCQASLFNKSASHPTAGAMSAGWLPRPPTGRTH